MAIKIGGTTVVDDSRNYNVGIATFNSLDIPINILTFSPTVGQTGVAINSNIVLTFNQQVGIGTTGSIRIREGSATGTIIQTIGITSSSVTLSSTGFQVTIDPPSNLQYGKTYYPVIDGGAFVAQCSPSIGRTSSTLNTYYFTTQSIDLGATIDGGQVYCKGGGTAWIAAPYSAQITTNWNDRGTANTCAQSVTGTTGWFIPDCGQLQSAYNCRFYWSTESARYWSDTQINVGGAYILNFINGVTCYSSKFESHRVRSIKTLSY